MGKQDYWYGWGNPNVNLYEKKFIRTIKVGGAVVRVHAFVADLVSEILVATQSHGVQLPATLGSWEPGLTGLGFEFVDGMLPSDYEPWGFHLVDGVGLVFSGTAREAKELGKLAESTRVMRAAPFIEKAEDAWQTFVPGTRDVFEGDKGDDVQFFQMYIGAADQSGVCNPETIMWSNVLQQRAGVPVTPSVDANTWACILPTSLNFSVEYGSTGLIVRALQCLLIAYNWVDDLDLTGRFDQETLAAIKHLQDTYGLRSTGICDMPEWAVLLGRQVRIV